LRRPKCRHRCSHHYSSVSRYNKQQTERGKERKGKERKGKERKGKERKGKERKGEREKIGRGIKEIRKR
jgi:hypothetical protein